MVVDTQVEATKARDNAVIPISIKRTNEITAPSIYPVSSTNLSKLLCIISMLENSERLERTVPLSS